MRSSQLLATLVTFSSLASAFSWPDAFENVKAVADIDGLIYGRADESSASATATPTTADTAQATATRSSKESAAGTTGESTAASTGSDASSTGKSTGKVTGKSSTATRKTTTASISDYDPRLPAGGIQMITPAAISGAQYYKISDWVTFAWNYTSLSVTPTAVDILATCTANQGTYTIAVNQTVEETGRVLWDTGAYQASATLPLLTETYTLVIYDADSSVSATAKAGYLAVFDTYTFGMYEKQPYQSYDPAVKCPTCSAAMSINERQTLSFLLGMATVTVLSFGWFAGSFGLF